MQASWCIEHVCIGIFSLSPVGTNCADAREPLLTQSVNAQFLLKAITSVCQCRNSSWIKIHSLTFSNQVLNSYIPTHINFPLWLEMNNNIICTHLKIAKSNEILTCIKTQVDKIMIISDWTVNLNRSPCPLWIWNHYKPQHYT